MLEESGSVFEGLSGIPYMQPKKTRSESESVCTRDTVQRTL